MDIGIGSRVRHAEFGVGVVIQVSSEELIITFVNHGVLDIDHTTADAELEVLERAEPIKNMVSLADIEDSLRKIVGTVTDETALVDMGEKWTGGKLIFQPGNPDLKPYELPVETFFHKIVMVRDRLRVMEQRVNSSSLSDEDKVNLQQYITRIYGSLTSFNVLFTSKQEGFTGVSSN
ncbi:MAG: hypothetical protein JXR03_04055 [Cyclobacteriaceae bacterium]